MTFGSGMVNYNSSKQKLNTEISTEAEVVGVNDYLQYNMWISLFMVEQVHGIKQNILFQYNHSEIKMKKTVISSALGNLGTYIYVISF